MEEQEKDLRFKVQEAMKDAEWIEKVRQTKPTEELCSLFGQKGIEVSEQEVKKLVSRITNNIIELNDEELEQVSGGIRGDHFS